MSDISMKASWMYKQGIYRVLNWLPAVHLFIVTMHRSATASVGTIFQHRIELCALELHCVELSTISNSNVKQFHSLIFPSIHIDWFAHSPNHFRNNICLTFSTAVRRVNISKREREKAQNSVCLQSLLMTRPKNVCRHHIVFISHPKTRWASVSKYWLLWKRYAFLHQTNCLLIVLSVRSLIANNLCRISRPLRNIWPVHYKR